MLFRSLPAAAAVTLAVPLVHLGMEPAELVRNGLGTLVAAVLLAGSVARLDPIGESAFETEEGDR